MTKERFVQKESRRTNKERNQKKIDELLEEYERNRNETRFKLRIKFGLTGKFVSYFLSLISISNIQI